MLRHAVLLGAAFLCLWPRDTLAYRPFDQTDADVAPLDTFELELGPVAYQHGPLGSALVPGVILNFGLVPRLEAVLEGDGLLALGPLASGTHRWQLDNSLLVKWVVRPGVLQDAPGPSIALETGILFPGIPRSERAGASLACIVSERWSASTVHLNLVVQQTRDGHFDVVAGGILEGPIRWTVRPVGEFFVDQSTAGTTEWSFLAGGIWRIQKRCRSTGRSGCSLRGRAPSSRLGSDSPGPSPSEVPREPAAHALTAQRTSRLRQHPIRRRAVQVRGAGLRARRQAAGWRPTIAGPVRFTYSPAPCPSIRSSSR